MGGSTTGSLQEIKLPIPVPILHLTREKFRAACKSAEAEILALLAEEGSTWGPKYVRTRMINPTNGAVYEKTFGRFQPWQNAWGPKKNFDHIARAKVWASYVHKMDTRDLTDQFVPKVMRDKEGKPYVGGIYRNGFSTGTSGAYGPVDHKIDEIINSRLIDNELVVGACFVGTCPGGHEEEVIILDRQENTLYLRRLSDQYCYRDPFQIERIYGMVFLHDPDCSVNVVRITKNAA